MKKIAIVLTVFAAAMFSGCVSTPNAIDESLLSEKTTEEQQRIYALEDQIIKLNKVLEETKLVTEEAEKGHATAKSDLKIAETEGQIFDEKEKVAKVNKDDNAIAEAQKQIRENKTKIDNLKIKLNFHEADVFLAKANEETKGAELNSASAELNLENAKIARRYQEKKIKEDDPDGSKAKKKDEEKGFFAKLFSSKDKGLINVEDYSSDFESKKDILKRRIEDQKIAQKKHDEAKAKVDKITK